MIKHAISLCVFISVLIVVAYFAVNNTDRIENDAALALIEYLKGQKYAPDVAVYSYPSDCGAEEEYLGNLDSDLFKDFIEANEYQNGPIYLSNLEGHINLLSWVDNVQVYDTERVSFKFRPSSKYLILVSRAGFNRDHTQAMFCVENDLSGVLFLMQFEDGRWRHKETIQVWVS